MAQWMPSFMHMAATYVQAVDCACTHNMRTLVHTSLEQHQIQGSMPGTHLGMSLIQVQNTDSSS